MAHPSPHDPGSWTPGHLPASHSSAASTVEGEKSFLTTLALSYLLGIFGADRFYLGKTGSGLLKLFTLGGFGFWYFFDLLITLFGAQRDAAGYRLKGYLKFRRPVWITIGAIASAIFLASLVFLIFEQYAISTHVGWSWLAGILIMIVATGFLASLTRHRRQNTRGPAAMGPVARSAGGSSQFAIEELKQLHQKYSLRALAGDPASLAIAQQMDSLLANVHVLITRIEGSAVIKKNRERLTQEYATRLKDLVKLLGPEFLLDVLVNAHLWDNHESHILLGQEALMAVDSQLIENLKQINGRRKVTFDRDLDKYLDFERHLRS